MRDSFFAHVLASAAGTLLAVGLICLFDYGVRRIQRWQHDRDRRGRIRR